MRKKIPGGLEFRHQILQGVGSNEFLSLSSSIDKLINALSPGKIIVIYLIICWVSTLIFILLLTLTSASEPTSPSEVELQLPNQWLWDMVDEFIYQFQSFSQYRSKLKNKSQVPFTDIPAVKCF